MSHKTKMHKIGSAAADRENIATAFEEIASAARAGRKGWGARGMGRAVKFIAKVHVTSAPMRELLEAFIAFSGPNAPLLRMMIGSDTGGGLASKIEGLPKLDPKDLRRGVEIGRPIDVEDLLPCACVKYDDGGAFHLGSFAGGRAKDGAYSFVRCVETKPDGSQVIHHYVRDETILVAR